MTRTTQRYQILYYIVGLISIYVVNIVGNVTFQATTDFTLKLISLTYPKTQCLTKLGRVRIAPNTTPPTGMVLTPIVLMGTLNRTILALPLPAPSTPKYNTTIQARILAPYSY